MTAPSASEAAWHRERALQTAGIRRMRLIAGGLLAAMFILFVATSLGLEHHPWLAYPRAFAEAAMVGACADWFAVVALFRHPFGLKIPRTAIIPRHQAEIGESLGRFISNNFLAPTEVTALLADINAAAWVAARLGDENRVRDLAVRIQTLLPRIASMLSDPRLHGFSRGMIRKAIDSIALAPLAARTLSALMTEGYHQLVFDKAIGAGQLYLADRRDGFRARVGKSSGSWMPSWVDNKLADAFLAELSESMTAALAPDHPWRALFADELRKLTSALAENPRTLESLETIKSQVLDNKLVGDYLDWLQGEIEEKIADAAESAEGPLSGGVEHALLALGRWLGSDPEAARSFNQGCRQLILSVIVPNRWEIGGFVAAVVARWETGTMVAKLEAQVGQDLQYIRINGTLVGGLVGLLIFAAAQLLR